MEKKIVEIKVCTIAIVSGDFNFRTFRAAKDSKQHTDLLAKYWSKSSKKNYCFCIKNNTLILTHVKLESKTQ